MSPTSIDLIPFVHSWDGALLERVLDLEEQVFGYRFVTTDEGEKLQVKWPINDDYLTNKALLRIFNLQSSDTEGKRGRIEALKRNYYQLMAMVELELDAREIEYVKFDSTILTPDF